MLRTANKVWNACFVVLLNFFVAFVVGAALGTTTFFVVWLLGASAHSTILGTRDRVSFLRRASAWLIAVLAGAIALVAVEEVLGRLALVSARTLGGRQSGSPDMLLLHFAGSLFGVIAAQSTGRVLVRRWSGHRPDAAPVATAPEMGTGWGLSRKRGSVLFAVAIFAAIVGFLAVADSMERRQRGERAQAEYLSSLGQEEARIAQTRQLPITPSAVLSLEALVAEYRENEIAAATKYESPLTRCFFLYGLGCRTVEISGVVRDLRREANGSAYITMATSDGYDSVSAQFGEAERESLGPLRRGQRVSVRCIVTDSDSAPFSLVRCGLAPS